MADVVARGEVAAKPELGHSIRVEAEGLEPDRFYYYQFKAGSEVSPVARTRTAPADGRTLDRLRFAFASCQHYETGYFTAYEHMAQEECDLLPKISAAFELPWINDVITVGSPRGFGRSQGFAAQSWCNTLQGTTTATSVSIVFEASKKWGAAPPPPTS